LNLLIFAIALFIYFFIHSLLAHENVKALLHPIIGQRYYRFFFNLIAIVSLVPVYFFYKKIDAEVLFEIKWLEYVGIGMIILGGIFSVKALLQYDLSEFSGTKQYRQQTATTVEKLQTNGMNRYVRHPLYFSLLLIVWGFFLFRSTDLILTVAGVTTIYLYFGTVLEEQKLINQFGNDYIEYQKRVPMLIPFFPTRLTGRQK